MGRAITISGNMSGKAVLEILFGYLFKGGRVRITLDADELVAALEGKNG